MHFIGVLNRNGGTLRTMDIDAFCAEATDIFSRHGHTLDCRAVEGDDLIEALEKAAAEEGADAILAGGGDGTISAAADIAFRTGTPLAVLPAGTMNLFARALHMPLDLTEALEAIAGGELFSVDIATANDRPFVHQFSVGIHTRLVRIREGLVYKSRIGKIAASLRAVSAAIVNPPRFSVEIVTPRGTERREASGISISNNLFAEGHIPHADVLDRGVLGVYLARPMTTGELLRLCLGVFSGRWKDNPFVTEREVTGITLNFPRRRRSDQAVVDGELIRLERTVRLQIHPGALRVVAPKPEREEAAAA
ncbi:diacylglycerol kinase family lipid kinase [Arsenicitalea aurantiaca]|uniref:Diacylglycerol kinase family lipid kinase n=1 Tax=Arsenicitalea aurantiaca TaxID=1783274 RepID=A0A433XLD5_9HYPH|nr:diacylglycerol kinase family protein [Arsenicitalea aurantiaca]RUT34897.1 diacylglycerol kinase family lipid kinase [Arsenicitalea aurantiaca]